MLLAAAPGRQPAERKGTASDLLTTMTRIVLLRLGADLAPPTIWESDAGMGDKTTVRSFWTFNPAHAPLENRHIRTSPRPGIASDGMTLGTDGEVRRFEEILANTGSR